MRAAAAEWRRPADRTLWETLGQIADGSLRGAAARTAARRARRLVARPPGGSRRRSPPADDRQLLIDFLPKPTRRTAFYCRTLHCLDTMGACLKRQLRSDQQRRETQVWRGHGLDFPSCRTEACAQGGEIRDALDRDRTATWRGAGPGGRFEAGRSPAEKERQLAARDRLVAAGLLDDIPTIDSRSPAGGQVDAPC